MNKIFLLFLFTLNILFADNLKPTNHLNASGGVTDIKYKDNYFIFTGAVNGHHGLKMNREINPHSKAAKCGKIFAEFITENGWDTQNNGEPTFIGKNGKYDTTTDLVISYNIEYRY